VLSVMTSFTASATALKPLPVYVGFANYAAILNDPLFFSSLGLTLLYAVLAVAANLGVALAYALLLDFAAAGRWARFFQAGDVPARGDAGRRGLRGVALAV
jgi:multiple sugar transport system permease protein